MSTCKRLVSASCLSFGLGLSGANADIVSVTGPIEVLPTPPASVAPGALATNGLIHAFLERQAVQLSNDLVMNILQPDDTTTYHPDVVDPASVNPGVLPAGAIVNCYLFHHNPATGAMTIGPGTVTFSEQILGLILFKDDLNITDTVLGAPGTVYGPYTGNRGLGTNASYPDDVLTLSGDGHTLTIDNLWTSGPILVDQLRVITVGGGGEDCNSNGIPDDQDIADGTSQDCNTNAVPDECETDTDADGQIDDCDACPDSDVHETIVIEGCNSDVANLLGDDGCSMGDAIAFCGGEATNHGAFVSCVAHLTDEWVTAGRITGREKGRIQRCAAQADIP